MLGFIKKLFGFDKETMKAAGVQIEQSPYKLEKPVEPSPTNGQCSDSVTQPDGNECKTTSVETQITDAVTQAPAAPKKAAPKKAAPKKAAPKKQGGNKPRGPRKAKPAVK